MLAKVFKIDVTICPKCQGSLRKIAAVVDPTEVRRYLKHVGLDCDPGSGSPEFPGGSWDGGAESRPFLWSRAHAAAIAQKIISRGIRI